MKEISFPQVVSPFEIPRIAASFGTPVYVYSEKILDEQANKTLNFPRAHGFNVRYAMKANPNTNILRFFDQKGIHIDASSGYEVMRAIRAGINPKNILLTSQQIPKNLSDFVSMGVEYNACSLFQLEKYGCENEISDVSVRINPGLGSGGTNRTNTGGPASSFGIWHEQFGEMLDILEKYKLNVKRLHTHIGSGSDPEVWKKVALMSLENVKRLLDAGHDVYTLNLGGGYKVGRMPDEKSTDLQECGNLVKQAFIDFRKKTGRALKLEIEPGTFLVANAGCLIASVIDVKRTSDYRFIVTDSGMTEITRPSLYGAQHPITIIPSTGPILKKVLEQVVTGHCCESGDILTPKSGEPEVLLPRKMLEAEIGDLVVIGGAGAYCAGMSTKNYNSYPEAAEIMINKDGQANLIRRRQTLEQMTQNEILIL
ncbi:MAG: diaminopimelate decarboxylase [Candidatus Pacearchaeota archaeon]